MQQSFMSVRSRAIDRRQMGSSFRRLIDRLVAISQGVWIYLTSSLSKQAEGIRADIYIDFKSMTLPHAPSTVRK